MKARVSKGFFGCNTARVDEYLRSLGVESASRISAAQRELDALLKTREENSARLAGKMEEVADYRRKGAAYVRLAGRGQAIASSILEAARYKSECINAAADRYVEEQEMYVLTLDRHIADAREQIEGLLKQIRAAAEAGAGRIDNGGASKVVGHVLSIADDNAPFTVTAARGYLEVDMSTQSVKVLSQDGVVVGGLRRLVLDKAKERVRGYEIEPLGQDGPLTLPAVVPSQAVVGLKRGAIIVKNAWLKETVRALDGSGPMARPVSGAGDVVEVTASLASGAVTSGRAVEAPEVAPIEVPAQAAPVEPAAQSALDVEGDVVARRMKYLVGRIVGVDILDANGSLIAAKGSTITTDTVDKARASGKLAELIVNMTLPGIGPGEESATG